MRFTVRCTLFSSKYASTCFSQQPPGHIVFLLMFLFLFSPPPFGGPDGPAATRDGREEKTFKTSSGGKTDFAPRFRSLELPVRVALIIFSRRCQTDHIIMPRAVADHSACSAIGWKSCICVTMVTRPCTRDAEILLP